MRKIALFLVFALIIAYVPCISAQDVAYPPFEDVGKISDEVFFGQWDEETEQWDIEPCINYSFDLELSATEDFAKDGRYDEAKEALLHYYRNRSYPYPTFGSARNALVAEMADRNIFLMENTPLDKIVVEDDQLREYSVEVPVNQYSFMFFAEDKSENSAFISSRESDTPPVLEIVQEDKTSYLPVLKDVYVSAGANSETNYGTTTELIVSDRGVPVDETTCIPYLFFDTSDIDKSVPITSATLRFYAKTDGGKKPVYLIMSSESEWKEDAATFEAISGRVYSWNGIEGGFDWKNPPHAHTEFLNVVLRLIFLESMVAEYVHTGDEHYAYRSIAQMLDFIDENGGLLHDPEPGVDKKSLNSGFRGGAAIAAFFALIKSESMDANAATAILKFMHDEQEALAMDINFQEDNNAGNFELNSFMGMTTYFPEFVKNSEWRGIVSERLDILADVLVRDDGSYIESTSGYVTGVLGTFAGFYDKAEVAGMELSDYFDDKFLKFARYLMGIMRPDGKEPDWGDGTNASLASYMTRASRLTDDSNIKYFATNGARGTLPDFTSVYYPQGKLAVMRTGWGADDLYTFVIGRLGGSHSHLHNMHMSIYAYGRYLLTDTGMTSYDPGNPHFLWQRENNISHNFIQIDDTPPPKIFDYSGNSLTDGYMHANGMFDFYKGYTNQYKGFVQYRNIMFLKPAGLWIVSDSVIPSDTEEHKYNLTWHTAADTQITMDEDGSVMTNYPAGANLKLIPVSDDLLASSLEDGVSIVNGPRNTGETKYTSYVKNVCGPVSFDTVLTVYPQGEPREMSVVRIPLSVSPDMASAFTIENTSDKTNAYYYISHESEPSIRRFGIYGTNGRAAYVEHSENGNINMISLVEASSLTSDNKTILETQEPINDISVSYGGSVVEVATSTLPNSSNEIKIYAPDAKKLLLNGAENAFDRDNEYIVITKVGEPSTDKENSGGNSGNGSNGGSNGGSSGGGGGSSRPVKGQSSYGGGSGAVVVPSQPSEPTTGNQTNVSPVPVFGDTVSHWAKDDITFLAGKGVVSGVSADSFEPERGVTRAEFAAMLSRLLKLENGDYKGLYADVPESEWFASSVEAVSVAGIVGGYNGLFNPNDNLSREQMAKMVMGAYGKPLSEETTGKAELFTDYALISQWAVPYVNAAAADGLFGGMPDGRFAPGESVTRAQAAAVLRRLYTALENDK